MNWRRALLNQNRPHCPSAQQGNWNSTCRRKVSSNDTESRVRTTTKVSLMVGDLRASFLPAWAPGGRLVAPAWVCETSQSKWKHPAAKCAVLECVKEECLAVQINAPSGIWPWSPTSASLRYLAAGFLKSASVSRCILMFPLCCRTPSLWPVWRRSKPNLPMRNTKESHGMSTLRCGFLCLLLKCLVYWRLTWNIEKCGISSDLQEINRSGTLAEIGLQGWPTPTDQ